MKLPLTVYAGNVLYFVALSICLATLLAACAQVPTTYEVEQPKVEMSVAHLSIQTTPENAQVRILNIEPVYHDGIALLPGRYQIEVTHPGYQRHIKWIELGTEDKIYSAVLNKQAQLFIRTNPKDAQVRILNIEPIYQTGMSLPPGRYQIEVTHPGYQRHIEWIKLKTKDKSLNVDLKEIPVTALNPDEIKMARIKPGCFQMGSPDDETGRNRDETQHYVCLTHGYYLGKYEVTQGLWRQVMGTNPSHFKNCGDRCPVENVSWNDVRKFIAKLNQLTGLQYRLPTEAEWEYAARAGGTPATYNGDLTVNGWHNAPELDAIAWYGGNSGVNYSNAVNCSTWPDKQYTAKHCGTHPVGLKKANVWGLYDMLGNVMEWVQDGYGKDYYKNSPSHDPQGQATDSYHVARGGSWKSRAEYVRSANRSGNAADSHSKYRGFRLARSR